MSSNSRCAEAAGLDPARIPAHVAIIMDGNGRWARAQGEDRLFGHYRGYRTLKDIVYAADELGVRFLTVYGFSSENWRRPANEVGGLMELMLNAMRAEIEELISNRIRVHVSGRLHELPPDLRAEFVAAMERTADFERMTFNLAINYGGRAEVVDAVRALAAKVRNGSLEPDAIDDSQIAAHLYAPDIPDPDLLIRTAGELRLSNFLLWETAYSEIYVTPHLLAGLRPGASYRRPVRLSEARPPIWRGCGINVKKRLVILGLTGSIGTQALDIVRRMPERFEIVGLAANGNASLLANQANEFSVPWLSIGSEALLSEVRSQAGNSRTLAGVEGMCELAALPEADLVVVAVAGAIGIAPTHAALANGTDIALASKEVLVAAGEPTMRLARERGAAILPIDSEHSAIFQCLQAAPPPSFGPSIEKILLTASGGPFRATPKEALADVTPEQALKHPTWNMGGLVTINSATLMNKALELIEAKWLFDVAMEDVEIVIHPQSIVHSMVRFTDGSTLAQLGLPDMRLPIQYALVYPERVHTGLPRMELKDFANLTFEEPDAAKFPSLGLARHAVSVGGTMPAVMNAANEAAVALFLDRKIAYLEIIRRIEQAMYNHTPSAPTIPAILDADAWARRFVCDSS